MPTTIETTVYTLAELKELANETNDRRAYEKALEWLSECESSFFDPQDSGPENYIPERYLTYLDKPKIVAWGIYPAEAMVNVEYINDLFNLLLECGLTPSQVNALRRYDYSVAVPNRRRDFHRADFTEDMVGSFERNYPRLSRAILAAGEALTDWYAELESDTAHAIRDDYEYLTGEEALTEMAEANGYTFTKGGERFG